MAEAPRDATLDALRAEFEDRCARLGALDAYRDWFHTSPEHNGSAHVEWDGASLHYVITERGQELERRRAADADELLYWLMKDVTSDLATHQSRAHRRPGEDFRRVWFARQEALLRMLDVAWGEAYAREREEILRRAPYSDER